MRGNGLQHKYSSQLKAKHVVSRSPQWVKKRRTPDYVLWNFTINVRQAWKLWGKLKIAELQRNENLWPQVSHHPPWISKPWEQWLQSHWTSTESRLTIFYRCAKHKFPPLTESDPLEVLGLKNYRTWQALKQPSSFSSPCMCSKYLNDSRLLAEEGRLRQESHLLGKQTSPFRDRLRGLSR